MTDSINADAAPWEEDATPTAYPEFEDAGDFADGAAENAVFDADADAGIDDENAPVPPEKEALIDEIASEFVGFWNVLVSRTNWEKGKVVHSWRTKLLEAGLPRRIYSDESISRRLGNVSAQHVGRLRRVFERFGATPPLPNLFWSHYQAALDWDDADDWLKKASDEGLSVAQTRIARWEKYGAPQSRKPKESEIVDAERDEDVNPRNDSDADFSAFDAPAFDPAFDPPEKGELSRKANAGRREYEGGDGSISSERSEIGDGAKARQTKKSPRDGEVDLGEFRGDDEPWESDPETKRQKTADVLDAISKLDPLPTDLSDAFETLKIAILNAKLTGWTDVEPIQIAAYLSAMKRLLLCEEK